MKIKVKYHNPNCKFNFIAKGEWIDLRASTSVDMLGPYVNTANNKVVIDNCIIPLGFAMELPKGFEAWILPRSSTAKKFGIICSNSKGIIDASFAGNNDVWGFPAIAIRNTTILEGSRICQFRIMPSQKASIWTKIKWLFTNKIEFVEVDNLCNENRDGFGSTGIS